MILRQKHATVFAGAIALVSTVFALEVTTNEAPRNNAAWGGLYVTPGAASNMALLSVPPVTPSCSGTAKSATSATLVSVAAASVAGDVITLADGTYNNVGVTLSKNGTAACPITYKPATYVSEGSSSNGVLFTNCPTSGGGKTCWQMDSQYNNVMGMRYGTGTGNAVIVMNGYGNRLYGNRFLAAAGDGQLAGCCGLVTSPGTSVWNSLNPNMLQRYNRIEANTVESGAANVFYVQSNGIVGNVISHNTILGAPSLSGFETEAFKIGYDFPKECNYTYLQFNTIDVTSYQGNPYTVGIKGSCVNISYNLIKGGHLNNRQGNQNNWIGNQTYDGSMQLGGDSNVYKYNYFKTTTGYWGEGPVVSRQDTNTDTTHCFYDGQSLPKTAPQEGIACPRYYDRPDNSTITENVFVLGYSASLVANDLPGNAGTGDSTNMTWSNNTFVRLCASAGNGSYIASSLLTGSQTWTSNHFVNYPAGSCGTASNSIATGGGNDTTLPAGLVPSSDTQTVKYDPAYVNLVVGGTPPATTTPTTITTTIAGTTTTTIPIATTTTTIPGGCIKVQSETGTVYSGAAVASDGNAEGGQAVGWFATGSGFTITPTLSAGWWSIRERYYSLGGATGAWGSPVNQSQSYPDTGTASYTYSGYRVFQASGGAISLSVTKTTGGMASDFVEFCPTTDPNGGGTTSTSTTTLPLTTSTTIPYVGTTTTTPYYVRWRCKIPFNRSC